MNRIEEAIKRTREKIEAVSEEGIKKLEENLRDLEIAELAFYQERKSLALMGNKITLEEAQTIYSILDCWATSDLAQKVAVTRAMGEMVK